MKKLLSVMLLTALAVGMSFGQGSKEAAPAVRDGMKTPTEDDTTSQIRAETNSQRQPRE